MSIGPISLDSFHLLLFSHIQLEPFKLRVLETGALAVVSGYYLSVRVGREDSIAKQQSQYLQSHQLSVFSYRTKTKYIDKCTSNHNEHVNVSLGACG